jgi:hypothetical protein
MVAGHVSPRVTIEALPDNVLLYIFYFCRLNTEGSTLDWLLTLYAKDGSTSPLRLNLRILCTETIHLMSYLDLWPPFLS